MFVRSNSKRKKIMTYFLLTLVVIFITFITFNIYNNKKMQSIESEIKKIIEQSKLIGKTSKAVYDFVKNNEESYQLVYDKSDPISFIKINSVGTTFWHNGKFGLLKWDLIVEFNYMVDDLGRHILTSFTMFREPWGY